jgi:hypothetical protein
MIDLTSSKIRTRVHLAARVIPKLLLAIQCLEGHRSNFYQPEFGQNEQPHAWFFQTDGNWGIL